MCNNNINLTYENNSCYIDSFLVALFNSKCNFIEKLLTSDINYDGLFNNPILIKFAILIQNELIKIFNNLTGIYQQLNTYRNNLRYYIARLYEFYFILNKRPSSIPPNNWINSSNDINAMYDLLNLIFKLSENNNDNFNKIPFYYTDINYSFNDSSSPIYIFNSDNLNELTIVDDIICIIFNKNIHTGGDQSINKAIQPQFVIKSKNNKLFYLNSIICILGNIQDNHDITNHYVTYYECNGRWYFYNDEKPRPIVISNTYNDLFNTIPDIQLKIVQLVYISFDTVTSNNYNNSNINLIKLETINTTIKNTYNDIIKTGYFNITVNPDIMHKKIFDQLEFFEYKNDHSIHKILYLIMKKMYNLNVNFIQYLPYNIVIDTFYNQLSDAIKNIITEIYRYYETELNSVPPKSIINIDDLQNISNHAQKINALFLTSTEYNTSNEYKINKSEIFNVIKNYLIQNKISLNVFFNNITIKTTKSTLANIYENLVAAGIKDAAAAAAAAAAKNGGSKSYEINDIYNYYYKIEDNNEIINNLLEIFNNDSSFIISILYLIINNEITDINIIFENFINDLQLLLNDLNDSDVLLMNNYDVNDIIFYVFMIYVYDKFNGLLSLSKKDIKITIKNDKLKLNIIENYHNIHKKLNDYFNGNEKYKFINYLKKYLQINYAKPLNNSKYLLSFIYNNNNYIEGYDSFLTFAYINVLNKISPYFYINETKYENTLPTLDIYDFSDMKNIKLKMTQKQEKIVSNLLKDKNQLLKLLLKRYQPRYITKKNTKFILNKQILDYLSTSTSDEFLNPMPIIDFDKYSNNDYQPPSNNDDIESNLFYYASLEVSNNVYVKLIKYYLLGQRKRLNKKLLDFSLYYICNINKDLDKSKIETRLIKELSNANIEIDLKIIKDFILPKCDITTINEQIILELLNYYYKKISFDTMIRYLSKLYKYDNNNKLQNQIQDLIEPLKLLKGGDGNEEQPSQSSQQQPSQSSQQQPSQSQQPILSTSSIDKLSINKINDTEDSVNKLIYILEKKLINIDEIDKTFNETIKFDITGIKDKINETLTDNEKKLKDLSANKFELLKTLDEELRSLDEKLANTATKTQDNFEEHSRTKKKRRDEFDEKQKIMTNESKIKSDIDIIKKIDRDLIFENMNDYNTSSKQYYNIILLLNTINNKYYDNNNTKFIIRKIIEKQEEKITKTKEKFKDIKKTFDNKIKSALNSSSKILSEFLNNIKDIPDKDDGIIKNLKNTYTKTDLIGINDKDPTIIIEDISKLNDKIFEEYDKFFDNTLEIYKNMLNILNNERRGGENKNNEIVYKGGGIEEIKKNINEKKKAILDDLNNISTKLKKFKANKETNKNAETKMASIGFLDEDGSNVFDRLMTTYDDNIKNKNMPYEVARNLFYSKAKNLNLDPTEELKITQNDKIVFCVIVYIIRLISLFICSILIDNNKFTALTSMLKSYVLWYIVILLIFVVIINIDAFKLRILINYLNMHVNSFGIIVHIILMLIFVYLIYLLTINILGNDQPELELSENEKIKLKYKLELLTAIIFIFICILVFII